MRYAANTGVPIERSRGEIERILTRYDAEGFIYGWTKTGASIAFKMQGRAIRFHLPLPDRAAKEFVRTPTRNSLRSSADAYRHWEQACRQRWRALTLSIKAKLETVESGISTFDVEFLPFTLLPSGHTVTEEIMPQINRAIERGIPLSLRLLGSGEESK